ncbi:MAG: thermonuclease family protein [Flavobacteriaceae bacterium]
MFNGFIARGLSIAALCAASVLGWLYLTQPVAPPPEPPRPPLMPKEPAPEVRDVTPPSALPGPVVSGELTRLPAREPPPPPPRPPEPTLLYRPLVVSVGVLKKGRETIRIAGIEPLALEADCTDGDGRRWRCGRAGATAFRMLVGRRALTCSAGFQPRAEEGGGAGRHCQIGKVDLGLWLVGQGWARPAADASETYRKAADEAREAQLGQYGPAPAVLTTDAGAPAAR